MWYFPHPETAIPLEEPADPRGSRSYRRIVDSGWEKCHIFWKKTQILFEFDSFFGVESGPFFAEKSAKFFRSFDFSSRTRKYFCGLFRKGKNESNFTRNRDIFEKMWFFPHPETAILPLERLPWGSASSYRRIAVRGWDKCHIFSQKSQYLVKFDSFFGVEIGNFSLFLGTPAGPWDDLPRFNLKALENFVILAETKKRENCHFSSQEKDNIFILVWKIILHGRIARKTMEPVLVFDVVNAKEHEEIQKDRKMELHIISRWFSIKKYLHLAVNKKLHLLLSPFCCYLIPVSYTHLTLPTKRIV